MYLFTFLFICFLTWSEGIYRWWWSATAFNSGAMWNYGNVQRRCSLWTKCKFQVSQGFAPGHTRPGNTAFAHMRVPLAMENGQWSTQMGYFAATHSVNPGRVGALKHCTVHMNRWRYRKATFYSTAETPSLQTPVDSGISIPTPTWQLLPAATPERNSVQPLFSRLVPEPRLCTEASPAVGGIIQPQEELRLLAHQRGNNPCQFL